MRIIPLMFLFCIFLSRFCHPEAITLKDGKIIEGKIVEKTDTYIVVDFYGVPLKYYTENIKTISAPSQHTGTVSIQELLKEAGYPERVRLALEAEFDRLFAARNFTSLQREARTVHINPQAMKSFMVKLNRFLREQGCFSHSPPHPLARLLVNGFSDNDIFVLIDKSGMNAAQKKKQKAGLVECSAISQLASILLRSLGFPVKTLDSWGRFSLWGNDLSAGAYSSLLESHVSNYISLPDNKIFVIDFTNSFFETIPLDEWYRHSGDRAWFLRSERRLFPSSMRHIKRRIQEGAKGSQSTSEALNLFFVSMYITDAPFASADICVNRGLFHALTASPEQAIANYDQALRLNANHPNAYSNRGKAYADKGDLEQAISDYSQALKFNPNDITAYNNRGSAYAKTGNPEQAIADFSQILQLDPDHATAYYNRGTVYAGKGDFNQAVVDFSRVLELDADDIQAYKNRAYAYFQLGDYDKAWEDVHVLEQLGGAADSDFLQSLRQASGQELDNEGQSL